MNYKKLAIWGGIAVACLIIPAWFMSDTGLNTMHGWVQKKKEASWAPKLQWRIARIAYGTGRWDMAVKHFTYYIEEFPDSDDQDWAMYYLAVSYYETDSGKPQAVEVLDQFLELYPDHEQYKKAEQSYELWKQ